MNRIVLEVGEPWEFQNRETLESALAGMQQIEHYKGFKDIIEYAAVLLWKIAKALGFRQGNKRTACLVAGVILGSGTDLSPEYFCWKIRDENIFYQFCLDCVEDRILQVECGSELKKILGIADGDPRIQF